ncbi:hypothetical protein DMC30DRAFT_13071 [Rhodotorula diobovata]|uniref:Proteophosphoglycan ppg4 n=1 Tax=Rhodotorula diobovata TaxID=5288 RepID=A0A5C5FR43_9BASI|nr:hypothetical protein DMC30DRAFT_13071 [Rhodotorula diobovata]
MSSSLRSRVLRSTPQVDLPDAALSLDDCVASFYDDASALHASLTALTARFHTLRALSARLAALHPNDLSTPTLALDLRDALLDAAKQLRDIDEGAFSLWDAEERVRAACGRGEYALDERQTAATGEQEGELAERRDEVDGLVRRLQRRVREVKREARGEARDRRRRARREGGDGTEPERVGDYLEEGVYEFPHLLTKDTVHASRWVVENPFTVLSRLTDELRSLKIPQLVKTGSTPATFVPAPSPPPLYHVEPPATTSLRHDPFQTSPTLSDNPTPAGVSFSIRRTPDWKREILTKAARDKARGEVTWSHRFFDEVALDLKEGAREIKIATGRGHREKWCVARPHALPARFSTDKLDTPRRIIFLVVALFPVLLIANLVEDFLSSRRESSSASSPSPGWGGSPSLRPLAPTMVNEQGGAAVTGLVGSIKAEHELRERRRRSADFDAALV